MIDTKKGNNLSGLEKFVDSGTPNLLKISNKLNKGQVKVEKLKEEYSKMPMPREFKNPEEKERIKRERKLAKSKITKAEKELREIKKESKELVIDEEIEQLNNLARKVNNPVKDFDKLDPIEFEKEKNNLLYRAIRVYDNKAEIFTKTIKTIASASEAVPICKGASKELDKSHGEIKDCVNLCLVDMGMKNISISNFINPYSALVITVFSPILAAVAKNYAIESEKKRKEKELKEEAEKKKLEKSMNNRLKKEI